MGGIFNTEARLKAYMDSRPDIAHLHPLQATVLILRERFVALVTHWYRTCGYGPQNPWADDRFQ